MSRLMKDADLETVINNVSKTRGQKVIEAFNSAYINSLLSGVFTQALNMKSGIYEALIRPLEQITGGALRGDKKAIRLGFAQYSGMMMHMGDVVKATHLALKQGDAILDPLARTQDNLGFGITPLPDRDSYQINYQYYKSHTELSSATDTLDLPDIYSDVVVNRAKYYAYKLRSDIPSANIANAEYEDGVKRVRVEALNKQDYMKDTRTNLEMSSRGSTSNPVFTY
jgi:hypothetical protein